MTTNANEPAQPAIEIDAPVVAARLGRGIRWSDLVAEMERDRLRSLLPVVEEDREAA